jgi:hypothetical protein
MIFSPSFQDSQGVPRGFTLVDEYFSASRAKDPLTANQQLLAGLQRTLAYLVKRYPKRIIVRWVNPWSFEGLWVSVRYRVRTFPAVLINRKIILVGTEIDDLTDRVADVLSQPSEPDSKPR